MGLWVQGDRVRPVCVNSGKSNPPGWRRGRRVQACRLKSRYKEPLSTSWHSSSCHLFSVLGIKTRLKAQDVRCRRFGYVCLQLPSEFLLGEPVKVSLLPLYPLYLLCFFNFTSLTTCVLGDFTWWENQAESFETPTLPWLLLFFSFLSFSPRIIIWKSTPQLSHFPGIWLRGRETLDGAGLVGPCKARAGVYLLSSSSNVSFVMFLADKCSTGGDEWRSPQYKTAIITGRSSSSVNKHLTCPNTSI